MNRRRAVLALASLLVLHVLLVVRTHGNFDHDHDSQHYARLAHEISQGEFELAPYTFNNRFGVIVPTAICYRLLGVDRYTTTLWPLIASLVCIALVGLVAGRLGGAGAGLLAAFVLAVDAEEVRYASRLLPEIPVSMAILTSLACLLAGRSSSSPPRQRVLGACCVVALCAGLLIKESALWGAMLVAGYLVRDVVRRSNARFWVAACAAGAVAGAVVLGGYWLCTGDALYRLHGIESTHNVRQWSFFGRSGAEFARRLTYEPLAVMLANPEFGIPLALASPALVDLVRPFGFLPRGTRFWATAFAVMLLAFWFGSTSLRSYNPLPVSSRYLIPLLPPLAILAAATTTALLATSRRRGGERAAALLVAAVALAGVALSWRSGRGSLPSYTACALAALALVWRLPAEDSPLRRPAAGRALAGLMVAAAALYYAPKDRLEELRPLMKLEHAMVDRALRGLTTPTVVFTDRQSAFILPFYFDSRLPPSLRVVDWSGPLDAPDLQAARKLVYVHQPRVFALNLNWGDPVPGFVQHTPDWPLVHEESDGETSLRLYEVSTVSELTSARDR